MTEPPIDNDARRISDAKAAWIKSVINRLTDNGVRREEIEVLEWSDGVTHIMARGHVDEFKVCIEIKGADAP